MKKITFVFAGLFVIVLTVLIAVFFAACRDAENIQKNNEIVLEGVIHKGKQGGYLCKDGINSEMIIAIEYYDLPNLNSYFEKKIKVSGVIVTHTHLETRGAHPPQSRVSQSFKVSKVISVSESQYERDIEKMNKILGNELISLEFEDESLEKFIDIVNSRYAAQKLKIRNESGCVSPKFVIVVEDIKMTDLVILAKRAGNLKIIIEEDTIILEPISGNK